MTASAPFSIGILYFAALKERAGLASEDVELPPGVRDVRALSAWLEVQRPALKGALQGIRFAVGDEFVDLEHELKAGDVIALLPPFSGG